MVEISSRDVPVSEIEHTVGPRPSERLVESVRRHGVVVPVILREIVSEEGELAYGIIDGNRRIASAWEAELPIVPAQVVSDITEADAAQVTLLTNSFRTGNYVTELWALRALERSGIDRRKLPAMTGMTASTIETRETLSRLDRRLFIGLAEGQIGPTVATAAARLDPEIQTRLVDEFARTGKLTRAQVDAVTPRKEDDADSEPEDIRAALLTLARAAHGRGIDEEGWLDAAKEAFRAAGG